MLATLIASAILFSPPPGDSAYVKQIEDWRKAQERDLTKPQGWLSLVGLVWLKDGLNTIGSARSCQVVLPPRSPAKFGAIIFKNGEATLQVEPGNAFSIGDGSAGESQSVASVAMQSDATRISSESATFMVIKRGARTGVRIWDLKAKGLTEFKGCKWFPVDPTFRIEADFVPYPTPKSMPITNILGDTAPVPNPGYVSFTLEGKRYRLEAQSQGGGLFFNFKDTTTGNETYPAGRFLDAPAPKDGKVILDFNRATNPPCAFTSFATCPLPPAANDLRVAIRAGEKTHHPHP